MEKRIVCRIDDKYLRNLLLMLGFSEGLEKIELVDRKNDNLRNIHDLSSVVIPIYDAHIYIKRRIPDYGFENK